MNTKGLATKLFPWLVGLSLLAVLLWRIPVEEAWQAMAVARLEVFLPLLAGACMLWFLIDAAVFSYLFSRFNAPLDFAQACALRGLTYLLTPIHWNLGRAAVIARLHQTRHVPLLAATSSMVLYQTVDAILLSGLAGIGLALLPATTTTTALWPLFAGTSLVLAAYLFVVCTPYPRSRISSRLRALALHHAHRQARSSDFAVIVLLKLAYYGVLLALYYWGAPSFGVDLPLELVFATVPIIQGLGALPISPAGLGTQQAAMLHFFSEGGSDAAIMAFGLSLPIGTILIRCLIGWPYLRGVAAKPDWPARPASVEVE